MGKHLLTPGHLAANATPNSVYRYFDHADRLIYIGITARGIQRQHEHEKLSDWFDHADHQQIEKCPDRASALTLERELIKAYRPPFNKVHNGDWEPVRAAYLAVTEAEEAYAQIVGGRLDGLCDPCGTEPDGSPCRYFTRGWTPEGAKEELGCCGRKGCSRCHARYHGMAEGFRLACDEAVDRAWQSVSDDLVEVVEQTARTIECGHCVECVGRKMRPTGEWGTCRILLVRNAEGGRYIDALCPHCGKFDCYYGQGYMDAQRHGAGAAVARVAPGGAI